MERKEYIRLQSVIDMVQKDTGKHEAWKAAQAETKQIWKKSEVWRPDQTIDYGWTTLQDYYE